MNLEEAPKSIVEIYYVANTPSFLFRMMREDSYVLMLSNQPANILINEFNKRTSKSISNTEEMAIIYALVIALSFKEMTDVGEFFHSLLKIKFEWFADLARIYLNSYKPAPLFQSLTIPPAEQSNSSIIIPTGKIIYSK